MPPELSNILLVEDEPAHAELVRRAFSGARTRYTVTVAEGLSEARAHLAAQPAVALIIADWRLNDGDGTELIHDQPRKEKIPVVIMTSHGNERIAVEAIKLGALDYVVKTEAILSEMPHIAERALRNWQNVLDRRSAEDQLRRRLRELTALSAVVMAGAEAADEGSLLRAVSELLQDDELYPNGVAVFMLDPGRRALRPISHSHDLAFVTAADELPAGNGVVGMVAATGKAQRVNGNCTDSADYKEFSPGQSVLCVPVKIQQRVIGVLAVSADAPRVFSDADEGLLATIASQLATALERLRSARAVVESEARFRRLSEAALEGILLAKEDGAILDANARVCQLSGYSLAELRLKSVYDLLEPASREFMARLIASLAPGTHETVGLRKDGARIPIEVEASRFEYGATDALIVAVREISERKRLEAELRQAQKMQVLGQLAGGIAHDFNNLLTVILGYSDLALVSLAEGSASIAGDVQQIRNAGQRAAALTRQLLAFSRRQLLNLELVDLNEIISGIHRMFERLIGEHIKLQTFLQPSMDPVRADRGQIEQVLMNLVANARDAMPAGGVLTIGTQELMLSERDAAAMPPLRVGPHILLTVADTGSGMDQETLSHLFEPFYTTKEPGRGTGLGLATVHGIVSQSNGYIAVASSPAQGTTFRIYLPVATQETVPATGVSSPVRTVPVADETILLVEDDPAVQQLADEVLRGHGYTILAATPDEALVLGSAYVGPIDLLVTDVVMPTIGGTDLAQRLVQLRSDLKVLFISGYSDEIVQMDTMGPAPVDFLQKPFTPESLLQKVRAVLDGT